MIFLAVVQFDHNGHQHDAKLRRPANDLNLSGIPEVVSEIAGICHNAPHVREIFRKVPRMPSQSMRLSPSAEDQISRLQFKTECGVYCCNR